MVNLSADDPSVAIFANKIANSTVTCNATEVEQLVVLEVQVNELAADITIQFTAVQVVIQGKIDLVDWFDLIDDIYFYVITKFASEATGSTVNPASVPSSTATKAARFRRIFDHLNRKMMKWRMTKYPYNSNTLNAQTKRTTEEHGVVEHCIGWWDFTEDK